MTYIDEGYIKFDCEWFKTELIEYDFTDLISYRNKMYDRNWIGYYEKFSVGFGNISERKHNKFIISGTQTGHLKHLTKENFTQIIDYNVECNWVKCVGPIEASSETMTHAIIYEQDTEIQAIIHIHSADLWRKYLNKIPSTRKEVPYGTPEMAFEIRRLFKETEVAQLKILAMAGHEEGIIAFGNTLDEAMKIILNYSENG